MEDSVIGGNNGHSPLIFIFLSKSKKKRKTTNSSLLERKERGLAPLSLKPFYYLPF
jgi:hypothetical protein